MGRQIVVPVVICRSFLTLEQKQHQLSHNTAQQPFLPMIKVQVRLSHTVYSFIALRPSMQAYLCRMQAYVSMPLCKPQKVLISQACIHAVYTIHCSVHPAPVFEQYRFVSMPVNESLYYL